MSHQWREIALTQPLLWSHVDFTTISLAGATEMLARERMAPLYLEATIPIVLWDSAWFSAFQKELQNHVSHICHLGVRAKLFYVERTLKGLILPAPTLESLSLSSEETVEFRTGTLLARQVRY